MHAFEEWGIDCLQRFRGMFALAIWDARTQRALARPRPHRHQAALLQRPPRPAHLRVRDQGAARGPAAGARGRRGGALPLPLVPDDARRRETLFDGIRKLARRYVAARRADGDDPRAALLGRLGPRRRRSTASPKTRSPSACSTSCARRSSCARSATCPSASSSPAASTRARTPRSSPRARPRRSRRSRSATRASTTRYQNELALRAPDGASVVGADHHERLLTQDDLLDFLPEMVQLQDEPIADPVCVPVYYVSKLARDNGVIVARSARAPTSSSAAIRPGRRCCGSQRCERRCRCRALAKRRRGRARLRGRARGTARGTSASAAASLGQPVFWGGAEAFTETQKQRLLSPRLRRAARRAHVLGRARADLRERFESAGAGSRRTCNWMTLPRSQPAAARAAADARRQDERWASASRGACRSSITSSSSSRCAIPTALKTQRRHAEAHPQEGRARRDPGRADRPAEAGLRRARLRVVLRPARRRGAHASSTRSAARPTSSIATR